MAEQKEAVKAAEKKTAAKKTAQPADLYTAAELEKNHKIFGASREIVNVALRLAKKDKATIEEAKKIIDEFKNREVK